MMNDAPPPTTDTSLTSDSFLDLAGQHIREEEWDALEALASDYLAAGVHPLEANFILALWATFHLDDIARAAQYVLAAIDINPDVAEVSDFLAILYVMAGDLSTGGYYAKTVVTMESDPRLRELLPVDFPDFAHFLANINQQPLLTKGLERMRQGLWAPAENYMRQHIYFFPADSVAFNGIASCLSIQGRHRGAVEILRASRHMFPELALFSAMLGEAHAALGAFDQSISCHRWARSVAPDDATIFVSGMNDKMMMPTVSTSDMIEDINHWGEAFAVKADNMFPIAPPGPRDKIKVGYIVGGTGATPSGDFISKILSNIDGERFKSIGFGLGELSNALNISYQKSFDEWQDIADADSITLGAMVAAGEVDILVDIAGFASPTTLASFGMRMAPCQIEWSHAPYGTGMPEIDGQLTDLYQEPDKVSQVYRARPFHLTHGNVVAALPDVEPDLLSREDAALTFAVDCPLGGLSVPTVECWSDILNRLPDATIVMRDYDFHDSENLNALTGYFGNYGLAHRIDIITETDDEKFFAEADIMLMPIHMAQIDEAVNGLWHGLPVVCFSGELRQMRQVGSMIHQFGLGDDMVADNADRYVELALKWAADKEGRGEFRRTIRDTLRNSEFFDPKVRAKEIEKVFDELWQEACQNEGVASEGSHS